ncbi:hypothetical protein MKZ38_002344 [Zalerion maritima]|uniref:Uncharacterized protein n=1 Tax=Zalerion maritima TaxID=339359 RepID=A0AAD5WVD7_9PEZI|nr:hypothetical protein MKZ38_002344 [Zalerion maritima]
MSTADHNQQSVLDGTHWFNVGNYADDTGPSSKPQNSSPSTSSSSSSSSISVSSGDWNRTSLPERVQVHPIRQVETPNQAKPEEEIYLLGIELAETKEALHKANLRLWEND